MHDENEISLKEFIRILLIGKKVIALFTLGFAILAIIVTLMLPKVYETESQLVFTIPESDSSRFGTYVFPSLNVADYIPLLNSDKIKSEVVLILDIPSIQNVNSQVVFNKDNKYVIVKTFASTPEYAKQLNDVLVKTYLNQIRSQYKALAIEKFVYNQEMNLVNLDYQIEKTKSMIDEKSKFLLEMNPVYTLQKALFADSEAASLYADKYNLDFSTISNDVILEEYVNEKYLEVEAEVIDLKLSLINMNENCKYSQNLLNQLMQEKEKFELHLERNEYNEALNDELDIIKDSINQVSDATVPQNKMSPNIFLNVTIGFIFGLMIGIVVVLFKDYWLSSSK